MHDAVERNYNMVKIYHSLEKSMSLRNRITGSGWKEVYVLSDLLRVADKSGNIGFHDKAAHDVVEKYIQLDGISGEQEGKKIHEYISMLDMHSAEQHGIKKLSGIELKKGMLETPETFFLSRYSLRNFKSEYVEEDIIKRSVALAMKTPSVCNRQAWHVYHTTDSIIKEKALRHQSGNSGFGDDIPNLMIITADLRAFMPAQEHFQHWIDGGLFSMSIIYALHSLGVASCCLNWSQTPSNDKLLRSVIDIEPSHTVIMMLAIGWPDKNNNVCVSARRPLEEVYTSMDSENSSRL
jgi:nitroreductase